MASVPTLYYSMWHYKVFPAGDDMVDSAVSVGSQCLARDSDDLWYRATVVDLLDDSRYHVMFDLSQREAKLDANELFPLHGTLTSIAVIVAVAHGTVPSIVTSTNEVEVM